MNQLAQETQVLNPQEVLDPQTGELKPLAGAAEKQHEIQSAIVMAKRIPRDEDMAFSKVMKSCLRSPFAEQCAYSFPRGKGQVMGPSVHLAREAARCWGNIRYGLDIIRDDEESRQIQGWAWDLETNTKVSAEDEFKKLIYRKKGGWIKPDERDLRELTNRRGAILVRNCLLQLLPKDLIEDALGKSSETLSAKVRTDPNKAKKDLILAFGQLSVTPEMLSEFLGHPLDQSSPSEIAELRTIYRSISDGNSKWSEYIRDDSGNAVQETGKLSMENLKPGQDEDAKSDTSNSKGQEVKKDKPIAKTKLASLYDLVEKKGATGHQLQAILGNHGYRQATEITTSDYQSIVGEINALEPKASSQEQGQLIE